MRKQLFYMFMFFGSVFTAGAQNTCATAVPVTVGSYTVGTIDGTYEGDCWATAGDFAEWYSYTAAANGFLRINTNLPINDGVTYSDDSRITVFSGTCAALTCYAASDDIDENNYLTDFSVAVAQGQTYYIAFDDRWNNMTIVFETSFTAETCFPVIEGFDYASDPTPTSVSIIWSPPAVGTPVGYEFEYGETGFTQGEGTMLTPTAAQANINDLTAATTYEFYIRTDCGGGDYSDWTGPVTFATPFDAADLPYSYGFEDDQGWLSTTWSIATNAQVGVEASYEGEAFAFNNTLDDAASDNWIFSRAVNVAAGETVNFSFFTSYLGGGPNANLDLTVGVTSDPMDHTVVQSFSIVPADGGIIYGEQTASWTADTAGAYVFGFHQNSPAVGVDNGGSLLLDAIEMTSSLGLEERSLAQLSIYPNPTDGYINITNNSNVLLNSVAITDINGRIVKTITLGSATNTQVNMLDIAAGMYLMTISSESGSITHKIIKQ